MKKIATSSHLPVYIETSKESKSSYLVTIVKLFHIKVVP